MKGKLLVGVVIMTTAIAGCDMTGMSQRNAARPPASNDAKDPEFKRLDTNNDGYLSKTELGAQVGANEHFSDIDTDKDGRISYAEWQAGGKLMNVRSN
jgi:Ca2+-binding EF-hand superfamily protein